MSGKRLEFTVPENVESISVKTFLRRQCKVSARMITRLKREKDGILREGKIIRTIDILKAGDTVVLNLPEDKNEIAPIKGELTILYEDDYVIVVDKPSNTPVHPTKIHQTDTLANYLVYRQRQRGENYTFRAINRLDKDTSGIVVVAKDRYTASALFNNLTKTYQAVCEGIIKESGTINKPIRLLEGHTIQRTTAPDGAPSITHYKPVMSVNNHTLLDIRLETGHTHQIRCHFSSINHPLAGDDMYGGSLEYIQRQALHCNSVCFIHPITQKEVQINSKLPKDINRLLNN